MSKILRTLSDSVHAGLRSLRRARPLPTSRRRILFLLPIFLISAGYLSTASAHGADSIRSQTEYSDASGPQPYAVAVPRYIPQGRPNYQSTDIPTETPTEVPTDTETPVPTDTETPVPTDTETLVPTDTETPVATDTETLVPTDTETLVPSDTETPTETLTATPMGPSNDNFAGAEPVTALPFISEITTIYSSTEPEDPIIACAAAPGQQSRSVWYAYTAAEFEALFIDTSSSNYDTVVAVWRNTVAGLTPVACSEAPTQTVSLAPGYTYYFEVAQSGIGAGGSLVFYMEHYSFHGLRADYFTNVNLTGSPVLTRVDPFVAFDWTGISPAPDIPNDNFSVRWSGRVIPQYSETYTFHTYSDDGVRLWVDGQLLIDNWYFHDPTWDAGSILLQAGTPYSIRMEYFQSSGTGVARLEWSSPSVPQEVIPAGALDYLDMEHSTVTSDGVQPLADGVDSSVITVTVLDSQNHPVAGLPVYLKVAGTGNRINGYTTESGVWMAVGDSNESGQVTATLASVIAGEKTVDAMVAGVGVGSPVAVVFVNGPVRRISVSHISGQEGTEGNGNTLSPSVSNDGSRVVFLSWADNLFPNDLNSNPDILILNTGTDTLSPAIFAESGGQPNDSIMDPKISGDGRFVVFSSFASNLSAGCTDGTPDIFVYQIAEGAPGTFLCVSVGLAGAEANGPSEHPGISRDGQYVVFASTATNLVPGVTDGLKHIYLADISVPDNISISLVSVNSDEEPANGDSDNPSVSANGRYVAFTAFDSATNLAGAGMDNNNAPDIFVRDRTLGDTVRVSVSYSGEDSNGASILPSISDDGNRVAFLSAAGNLIAGIPDLMNVWNVYLRDIPSSTTSLASVSTSAAGANGDATFASISADGMHVVFASAATNLVPEGGSGITQIYLRDFEDSETTKISVDANGAEGDAVSSAAGMSADGTTVSFVSDAANLVAGDFNSSTDAFLSTRSAPVRAPGNDLFGAAITPGAFPYSEIGSTAGATSSINDPVLSCGGTPSQQYNSVWYTIQPGADAGYLLSTIGSDYDTIIAVWTGTQGDLQMAACNDDSDGLQSSLEFLAEGGTRYWIEVVRKDSPGGGTLVFSMDVVVAPPVAVLVLDSSWNPDVGLTVEAYDGDIYTGYSATTGENGRAFLTLPAGHYRFRVVKNGTEFWSGASNHCTIPGCTTADIETSIPTVVTVVNLEGLPIAGTMVHAFSGSTYTGRSLQTNELGQATFTLPAGSYNFRADVSGYPFWSGAPNSCSLPGCTSAGITVNNSIVVTVLDTAGNPEAGLNVMAFNGSTFAGIAVITDAQGKATLPLPAGSFRFRVIKNGSAFWSGTSNHCTVPGCTEAGITTTLPVIVTVRDLDGLPVANIKVHAFNESTYTSISTTTNELGQATFTLPPGSYRFRADRGRFEFWSGPGNHCSIPGCTSVDMTVNNAVIVTVRDTGGNPDPGLTVAAFNNDTNLGYPVVTDAQGQAMIVLPAGDYRFRVIKNGTAFWSDPANHCTVPTCNNADITTSIPIIVTVLDQTGQPAVNVVVNAFDGSAYTNHSVRTDAEGRAAFTLPAGSYHFRADIGGYSFWSQPENHCSVPGCTSTGITVNNMVLVTVLNTSGAPEAGTTVMAYNDVEFAGYSIVTNAQGQALFPLPEGAYRFRVSKNGTEFWSGAPNHCAVPACSSAGITTTIPMTVTVLDLNGDPVAGLRVHAFDGSNYTNISGTTNAQGQVGFTLPIGSYRFRADRNGYSFWSNASNHCSLPGCTHAEITVNSPVVVTVLDTNGTPEAGLTILAYEGATFAGYTAVTDAQGQATLALPAGSFRFRATKNGTAFWTLPISHCQVPECTAASITTTIPVVVTVLNAGGQPYAGIPVYAFDGSAYANFSVTTNAQGQAVFTLPIGHYRFRADSYRYSFWSGAENHCSLPGCASAGITVGNPVVITVLDTDGSPEIGKEVMAFSGSTFAGYSGFTDALGQVTLPMPAGDYRFRAMKDGTPLWSGPPNHCAVPGCASAAITTTFPVTVTVLNLTGQPVAGLKVHAFDGSAYTDISGTTNAQGQAVFTLPVGSYHFRADRNGYSFWSSPVNNCSIPGCTTAGITVNNVVMVTVLNTSGTPEAGLTVMAYDGATFAGYSLVTNAQGQVILPLPAGSYHFRVSKNGTAFWSNPVNNCTVPGCGSASITTTISTTVTVLDLGGLPVSGIRVHAFDGSTYTNYSATTNAQGQAVFTLPIGSYHFRADRNGYEFWSNPTNNCSIPGCTTAGITVNNPVTVTVLNTSGAPEAGLTVMAYNGSTFAGFSIVTNAQGQATLPLPAGSFRFRVTKNGTAFWSGAANHCTVPGCSTAAITTTLPVTVTVLDAGSQPVSGIKVNAFDGSTYTNYSVTTNAQGQAVFTLPVGSYHFRADRNGYEFWSNPTNNCSLPGCATAGITVGNPVVITVLDTNGTPEVGKEVMAFSGSTFAGYSGFTDALGQVTLPMPAGAYRFRAMKNGTPLWSGPPNHCAVPGCASAAITTTFPVTVTVLNLTGQPVAGLKVHAFDGSAYTDISGTTNAQGQVVFTLPVGSYHFRADRNGYSFWSSPVNNCSIPGCTTAGITVNNVVMVTVLNTSGTPEAGLTVMAYDGATFAGYSLVTNAQGQVILPLPAGSYHFRVSKNGTAFWSNPVNNCTVPGCGSASITTTISTTVTVLDLGGLPVSGIRVHAFDGSTYTNYSATTNAQGQAVFTLPIGSYHFRADRNGYEFWSNPTNNCSIPGCTTAGITVNNPVTVTVLNTSGAPEAGLTVMAYNGSTFAGFSIVTNAQGQATLPLPAGSFRFRVTKNGTAFWSGATNHCTVPGCSTAAITTTIPVTVTVLDAGSQPVSGIKVNAFDGSTYTNYSVTTNAQGQAVFTLPVGSYHFRADRNGYEFWSNPTNNCSLPGCTTAGITVSNPVTVTVLDTSGTPEAGMTVQAYNGSTFAGISIVTNAQGQATLPLPAGSFRFRVTKNGTAFWSGAANHCTVPGCSTAAITTTLPVTVTVLNLTGQPVSGLRVHAFDGSVYTEISGTTNALGQAVFTLPVGSYRFRADRDGYEFWSNSVNHCSLPGCSSAGITVNNPVVVTVLDTSGNPEVGRTVMAYDGATFAGYSIVTNAQGQATLPLPAGSFRFRVTKNGTAFWSGTTNHCTVPGCATASITTTIPMTVTVLDLSSQPASGLRVYAFDESTYTNYSATTNAEGLAVFTLPIGNYRFRADLSGYEFWSDAENHCGIPGCTNAGVTVNNTVVVTVQDNESHPEAGLTVMAFTGTTFAGYSGVTDAMGQVTLPLPAGSYRFRVVKDSTPYWSGGVNHCTVPGCTTAGITTGGGGFAMGRTDPGEILAGVPLAGFSFMERWKAAYNQLLLI